MRRLLLCALLLATLYAPAQTPTAPPQGRVLDDGTPTPPAAKAAPQAPPMGQPKQAAPQRQEKPAPVAPQGQAGPRYSEPEVPPAYSVQVVASGVPGPTVSHSMGSGTVVKVEPGRMLVVTCDHVVGRGPATIVVTTCDGVKHAAKLVASRPSRDLALLEIRLSGPTKAQAATLATGESYQEGTATFRVGYPGGQSKARVVPGELTHHRLGDPRHPGWESVNSTVPAASGHSGGGLFRASDGAMIGVVHSRNDLPGGGTSATKIDDVHAMLTQATAGAAAKASPAPDRAKLVELKPATNGLRFKAMFTCESAGEGAMGPEASLKASLQHAGQIEAVGSMTLLGKPLAGGARVGKRYVVTVEEVVEK